MRRTMLLIASGCVLGWGTAASAQGTAPPPPDPSGGVAQPGEGNPTYGRVLPSDPMALPPPAPVMPAPMQSPGTPTPTRDEQTYNTAPRMNLGAALLLGGGFEDFTNSNLRSMTSSGGSWNARAIAGTRQYVGLEAAYVGTAHGINTLGANSNANLVSNGLEGALRLNLPVMRGLSMVEPFGFVGLGWQHYAVNNGNSSTSDISDKDDIMTLPVGGGLEYSYRKFMADVRFTYRETYYNNILRTTGGNLNNWGVGGQVGVAF